MFSAFILALSLAQGSLTGIVKDTSGGTVSQATIVVRTGSTVTEQTVTGPDGTFTVAAAPGSTLIVRAGGFAERQLPFPDNGTVEIVLSPAGVLETLTVTPARTEQLLGNVPRASPCSIGRTSGGRPRSWPTTCCARFRRSACSGGRAACRRTRRRKACRCAASARAASAVRWCCSTACRSTIRSAVGCTGRACRWRAPSASRWWTDRSSSLYGNYAMGGVINIISARPSAATAGSASAIRQPEHAQGRLLRQRRHGRAGRRGRRQPVRH